MLICKKNEMLSREHKETKKEKLDKNIKELKVAEYSKNETTEKHGKLQVMLKDRDL